MQPKDGLLMFFNALGLAVFLISQIGTSYDRHSRTFLFFIFLHIMFGPSKEATMSHPETWRGFIQVLSVLTLRILSLPQPTGGNLN